MRARRSARDGPSCSGLSGVRTWIIWVISPQGFELALKGLAILKKSILGVIHLVEQFADADEVVGDSAEVRVIGVVAESHQGDPWVQSGAGWARTRRLVKLAPRSVFSGVRPHRLDRTRQRSHLVAESFDIEEQGVLRPRELVDGGTQACELVAQAAPAKGVSPALVRRGQGSIGAPTAKEVQAPEPRSCWLEDSTGFGPRLKTEPGWARRMNSIDRWTFARSSRW
jgi:hypothetical protein